MRQGWATPLLTLALLCVIPQTSVAFHDGGVASCDGCHITHRSEDGFPVVPSGLPGWSLRAATPSDVCLMCHAESFGAVLGADPLAPPPELGAGNFVFLLEDNLNDGPAGGIPANWIRGDRAGHNIVAPAYALQADSQNTTSPGGSFPSDQLGCTSCHDPHGRDSFRLLYGEGPIQDDLFTFAYPAPAAQGIDISLQVETPTSHTAYQEGMGRWCSNCHGWFHDEVAGFTHPFNGQLGGDEVLQYNSYDGEGNPAGSQATAYLPEVPFEALSNTSDSTEGPSVGSGSRVMCLSCHRAHASSAPHGLRWDPKVALLEEDGLVSGSYPLPNPYPSSPLQGPLCVKCHSGGAPAAASEGGASLLKILFD